MDGFPIVTGLACILRQSHPLISRKVIQYLGQFIKLTVQTVYTINDVDSKAVSIPEEIINILIFIEQLSLELVIPKETIYEFIPPHLLDSAKARV